jgi:hypothetical protein
MCSLAVDMLVQRRQQKKIKKYADIINGVNVVPVAIETSSILGQQALELFQTLGERWRPSHTSPCSSVSGSQLLFKAAMPATFCEHSALKMMIHNKTFGRLHRLDFINFALSIFFIDWTSFLCLNMIIIIFNKYNDL